MATLDRENDFTMITEEEWQEFAFSSVKDVSSLVRKTSESIKLKPLYTENDRQDYYHLLREGGAKQTKLVAELENAEEYEVLKELEVDVFLLKLSGKLLGQYPENPFTRLKESQAHFFIDFWKCPLKEAHFWSQFFTHHLNISFFFDPITFSLKKNKVFPSYNQQLDEAFQFAENFPGNFFLSVDGHFLNSLGLNDGEELAHLLYIFHSYLLQVKDKGGSGKGLFSKTTFKTSVNSKTFKSIAKLRALNILLHRLFFEVTGQVYKKDHFHILALASDREKQYIDTHSNILRETSANFSAQVGGAACYKVSEFTKGRPEGKRLAINSFHILKQEAFISDVEDAAGGSYYLDKLTDQLAQKVWTDFLRLKNNDKSPEDYFFNGGFKKVLEGKDLSCEKVIGVNIFKNTLPSRVDKLEETTFDWKKNQEFSDKDWERLKKDLEDFDQQFQESSSKLDFSPLKEGESHE